MLKMGSYGLSLFLPLIKLNTVIRFYFAMGLLGSVLSSLVCLRQGDMKKLIAYSSVVHMGVVTMGFVSATEVGYACAIIIIIGHGLTSPFLFLVSY